MADAMLYGRPIECSQDEFSILNPPSGQTCGEYLQPYLTRAPGTLENPGARSDCRYCSLSSANQFLSGVDIYWTDRWRDFGLMWVYVFFNIGVTVWLYWFFRVRKSSGKKSVGLGQRLGAIRQSLHNKSKAKGRVNKRNAEVF